MAKDSDDLGEVRILNDVINLEAYAKAGKAPPLATAYEIKINGDPYVISNSMVTGREILTLAGLLPAEKYTLRMKILDKRPVKINLDEEVDLRKPGIEKFKALPRDQTDG